MIKRFNPDFSLSISHELAYMRETPEGGYVAHGDYASLFSELELVKAERDALERQLSMSEAKCKGYFSDAAAALVRCDALAVENNKLCKKLTHAEGCFKAAIFEGLDEALVESAGSNLADIVSRRIVHAFPSIGEPTPATSAALAAIRADAMAEGAEACVRALVTSDDDDFTDAPNICAMVAYQLREAK